ncbi:tail fiber protein [Planktotalea sp.]|uniref:phage tail protein n=1 Tax=Planktotalea sp. TaxID=2029877 RepID=UPI003296BDD6
MEPFLAQIVMFGGNFAPRGWALCDGQLLPISSNSALFSILGTIYGGDGRTTFALPDLRGRFPLHPGNGPGLPSYREGQKGGQYEVSLTIPHLPSHNHTAILQAGQVPATSQNAAGKVLGGAEIYEADVPASNLTAMGPDSVRLANTGGSIPFSIENPYTAVNFIIALQGVFPSRS